MVSPPTPENYRVDRWDGSTFEALREEFEWEIPDQFNLATYVCDRWADDSGQTALYETRNDGTKDEWTFQEVQRAANALATHFDNAGIERGDHIAVSGSQRPETIITHIAAWKLGAVSVPVSVLLGPDGLHNRLADVSPKAHLAYGENIAACREIWSALTSVQVHLTGERVTTTDDEISFVDAVAAESSEFETVETAADDPAIVFYTSGTTGDPKGVVHRHSSILGILPAALTLHNLVVDDKEVYRAVSELSWVQSLLDVALPGLFFGIPFVLHDRTEFDPIQELRLIDEYDVTVEWIPPAALRLLREREKEIEHFDLSSLRVVGSGGSALGDNLVAWAEEVFPNAVVHEAYGQTELPACIGDCSALGVPHRAGRMGRPSPGYEVTVLDQETESPLKDSGQVGELAVRADTPLCFLEYRNQPEQTAAKVTDDGWLRCEDLVSIDEDGYVAFHGRADDVIISAGYRLSPAEIEETVTSHAAVRDAGVLGIPHEVRGEVPKAVVVLNDGYTASETLAKDIENHVKERLAKYEYPREIAFVEELPRTRTGKVRRDALRETEESR